MILRADQFQGNLAGAGIGADSRVAVLSENSAAYVVLIAACWSVGAVVIPISRAYPAEKIKAVLKQAGAGILLVSEKSGEISFPEICETRRLAELIPLDGDARTVSFRPGGIELASPVSASVIFTSGTTGAPRGIVHPMRNHYYSALGAHDKIPFSVGDRWLMSLPLYHVSGLSIVARALLNGGEIAFADGALPLAENLESLGITHLSLVPFQLGKLLGERKDFSSLKLKAVLVGGGPVSEKLVDESFAKHLPAAPTYGLTEMASQVTTAAPGPSGGKFRNLGRPLKYRQLKISPDGEILVKGETLFRGYIRPESDILERPLDDDGWFHTGDLGCLDEGGGLIFKGRRDLMFISGGENIYPEEVEIALRDIEGIADAVVVSVDDKSYGRRPAAFVRMEKPGGLNIERLKAEMRSRVEPFKIPVRFFEWPDECGGGLKPDRRRLEQIAKQKI